VVHTTLAVLYQEHEMFFIFPKKKIVLDCFTDNELVLKTAPVTNAMKHIPEWWKKLPSTFVREGGFAPSPTMKYCTGMVDYYKKSIAIPLWSDLCIDVSNDIYRWQFADGQTYGSIHPIEKEAPGLLSEHGHIKIESPWIFRTKEKVSWTWSQPMYSFTGDLSDIKILPGVIDYFNQATTSINVMIPLGQIKNYFLHHGQALVHLTPMFENEVKIARHLLTEKEYKRMKNQQIMPVFSKRYISLVKAKEKFINCPYKKGV
jgi:hypothetical protein